jgi:SNF2 family DNA or RNA helicase
VDKRLKQSSNITPSKKYQSRHPFLLTPWLRMREYQQIGLNWLVSLQSRRLNGILADGKHLAVKSFSIFTDSNMLYI